MSPRLFLVCALAMLAASICHAAPHPDDLLYRGNIYLFPEDYEPKPFDCFPRGQVYSRGLDMPLFLTTNVTKEVEGVPLNYELKLNGSQGLIPVVRRHHVVEHQGITYDISNAWSLEPYGDYDNQYIGGYRWPLPAQGETLVLCGRVYGWSGQHHSNLTIVRRDTGQRWDGAWVNGALSHSGLIGHPVPEPAASAWSLILAIIYRRYTMYRKVVDTMS